MSQKKFAGLVAAALGAALLLSGCGTDEKQSYSSDQERAIAERIAPVGEVAMEGDPIAAAPVVVAASGPRTGEEVYKKSCFVCHTTGAAGAPKLADGAAWELRIAKGIETLFGSAWNGFKTMPAKGNCFDCSEEEIQNAVKYLVDSVK